MFALGLVNVIVYGVFDLVLGSAIMIDKTIGGTTILLITIFYLVAGAFDVYAGAYGMKHSTDSSKAATCRTYGIISIAIMVITFIAHQVVQPDSTKLVMNIISLVASTAIPLIYIHGASLNMKG